MIPSMGWIRWTGKALELAGKIVQADSFEKWAEEKGQAIVEKVAVEKGRTIFHTANSRAKADIWGELADQFKSNEIFASGMKKAIGGYTERLSTFVGNHSRALPRHSASAHVWVVPLYVVNRNERQWWQGLDSSKELANLKGGPELRAYFFDEMTRQLGVAFSAAAKEAKPDKPIQLESSRWVIGFDPDYEWNDSKGHYYVFSYYSQTDSKAKGDPRRQAENQAAAELSGCKEWLFLLKDGQRRELSEHLP